MDGQKGIAARGEQLAQRQGPRAAQVSSQLGKSQAVWGINSQRVGLQQAALERLGKSLVQPPRDVVGLPRIDGGLKVCMKGFVRKPCEHLAGYLFEAGGVLAVEGGNLAASRSALLLPLTLLGRENFC